MVKNTLKISLLISASIFISVFASADDPSIFLKLAQGQQYEKIGKYQEALAEYESAMREDPRNEHVYMSLGLIYQYKLNDKKKAIEFYKKGIGYAPNNYGMSLNLMYAYFDVGDFGNAVRLYEQVSNMQHKSLHTFPKDALRTIFLNMNEEEVICFCKNFLSINPGDSILREKLSELYIERKDYKNARPQFEARLKYSRTTDNLGPTYFGLAVCDYYLEQYLSSIDYLDKAKAAGEYVPDQYFEMVREKISK